MACWRCSRNGERRKECPLDLVIRTREGSRPGSQEVEVVERKGLGHPDTICDGIAEKICVRLCRYYLEHFDRILHHNVDKILLVGGAARASFGGGEIVDPIEIYLAGRATDRFRGEPIPVHDIAVEACRDWIRSNLRGITSDRDIRIVPRLRPGSADLARLFAANDHPISNDTSCGAGFAPLTDLERIVLQVERTLNSARTKQDRPEIGEDVKVVGVRRQSHIDLTIACAFVGRFIRDIDDYVRKKVAVRELARETAGRLTTLEIDATVNAADDIESGSVFLTVTGTSAEAGDDGEVGRGNRTSGLITPYRPMTLEAAAGKNPVTHVGKLYNLAASRIANAIVTRIRDVTDAECVLLSQIGRRVEDPHVVDIALATEDGPVSNALRTAVADLARSQLGQMHVLRDDLLSERLTVY